MPMIPFRRPGTEATLRGVGAKVFWAYPTIVVQDTADWIALYLPAGAAGKDTERKPAPREFLSPEAIRIIDWTWELTDVLMLIAPGEAFSTYLMWTTGTRDLDCWYINLQEPIRRTRIGFDTMDHMLDVVMSPDMVQWNWKDEDEFAEAERIGLYSHEKAREIRAQGEKAVQTLRTERRAFYTAWINWQPNAAWKIPRLASAWNSVEPDVASQAS
jgi:uncharacterized protein DUF402